jgi:DedD protein
VIEPEGPDTELGLMDGLDEDEVHFFCRLTFGQFFTLTMLGVMTICASFYLGARYGNNYLRLEGLPDDAAARISTRALQPAAPAPRLTTGQTDAIKDEELKAMARKALWKEQRHKLEAELEDYLTNPVDPVPAPAPAHTERRSSDPSRIEGLREQVAAQERERALAPEAVVPGAVSREEIVRSAGPPQAGRSATVRIPPKHGRTSRSRATPSHRARPPHRAQPAAATPPSTPTPTPSATAPVMQLQGASGLPYSVQVGAFRNYTEAASRLSQWKSKGYAAYVVSADLPEKGRWYRLRVGAYATRGEAKTMREDLKSREAIDGIVVLNH